MSMPVMKVIVAMAVIMDQGMMMVEMGVSLAYEHPGSEDHDGQSDQKHLMRGLGEEDKREENSKERGKSKKDHGAGGTDRTESEKEEYAYEPTEAEETDYQIHRYL